MPVLLNEKKAVARRGASAGKRLAAAYPAAEKLK
jgi:hypothetical protein